MAWGWAAKKLQNSRIAMVTKEVKWELESSSKEDLAFLLAMATVLRLQFQEELSEGPFFNPSMIPEKMLRDVYNGFEDLVNLTNSQAKAHEQGMFGLPEFVKRQTKMSNTALKIWMATIGTSLRPSGRNDVRTIWKYLAS